jgi:CRISPR system Cascade subunit CasB
MLYDFTYFDFAHRLPCARHPFGTRGGELLPSLRGPFRLTDHPEALRVSWVPWNKAYRRSFVVAAGLRFPSGYYEDALWSTTALLAAASISTLARPCVSYRCCRADSYSQKPHPGHVGILDRYEQITEYMRAHPELSPAPVREEMARVMSGFLDEMVSRRPVIPADLLPDFRSRARRFLRERFGDRPDGAATR